MVYFAVPSTVHPKVYPKYVLNNVRKGAQESTIKFESKQNIVNGLIF